MEKRKKKAEEVNKKSRLPKTTKAKIPKTIIERISVNRSMEWSGPIPPPSVMESFEKIKPGFAERIMVMTENQSRHRQEMQKKITGIYGKRTLRGQYFSVAISILTIFLAFYAISKGFALSAVGIAVAVIGQVVALILSRKNK